MSVPSLHDSLRLSLEFALDRVSDGIVLVDGRARLLHVNRPAREFLASRRCSRTQDGELRFLNPETQHAFRLAFEGSRRRVCEAISGAPGDAEPDADRKLDAEFGHPGEFLVRDECGAVRARAAVEPLRRTASTEVHTFLVSIHPQPRDAAVSPRALVALYGLTPAEARVAAQVVSVGSILEIAERLSLSINTVKVHLRSVFRKCQVESFAELATLVATGPGVRSVSERTPLPSTAPRTRVAA